MLKFCSIPWDCAKFYLQSTILFSSSLVKHCECFQSPKSLEVTRESRLRFQASSLIQLILVVLNSSHTSLPSARWYVQELSNIQERAAQFKVSGHISGNRNCLFNVSGHISGYRNVSGQISGYRNCLFKVSGQISGYRNCLLKVSGQILGYRNRLFKVSGQISGYRKFLEIKKCSEILLN